MPAAPLMHGASQWATFQVLNGGGTVVFPTDRVQFDPPSIWQTVVDEGVAVLQIVGDAMARPLLDELEAGQYDVSKLFALASGGAMLHPSLKARFLELVPHAVLIDAVGSSEGGVQLGSVASSGTDVTQAKFEPGIDTCVVSRDLSRVLTPGSVEVGWLAQSNCVPLGYLGDAAKTAATFPVIEGVRYSVSGDRAMWRADGSVELLGRDSVTINSGGEKIFVEEVELAVAYHPDVYDVVVVGRPSERWGSEVVAVVALREGATATDDDLWQRPVSTSPGTNFRRLSCTARLSSGR